MTSSKDERAAPASLSKAFDITTPPAYLRAAQNPVAFRTLAGIEQRADRVRARALDHYKQFEDRWTAKEAMRLWLRHHAQAGPQPSPPGARRDVSPEAMMKLASRNVQARTNLRLSKITAIQTRMSNAVVRNVEAVSLKNSFASPALGESNVNRPRRTR